MSPDSLAGESQDGTHPVPERQRGEGVTEQQKPKKRGSYGMRGKRHREESKRRIAAGVAAYHAGRRAASTSYSTLNPSG